VSGSGAAGASFGAAAGGTAKSTLGKDDFLKLLLAQLSNQDPLRPMDDKEFIAQLAQFNTLEQMQQMNQHLIDLALSQSLAQASALLGRQVEAAGENDTVITGAVTAAGLVDGQAVLTVGDTQVALGAVTRIFTTDSSTSATASPAAAPSSSAMAGAAAGPSAGSPVGTATGAPGAS
jgi:flagellar basal-body rod modification protein FlgD